MNNVLAFDRERHEYTLDGVRLPSVSEIIAPLVDLSSVPEDRLAFARDRGTAVHLACHLDDDGSLDEGSLDSDSVAPYLRAYRAWRSECGVRIHCGEKPMASKAHKFAGTPDRVVEMDIASNGKALRRRAVVDIKVVAKMRPVTGVQLAGYDILVEAHERISVDARIGLQLFKDGTYRMHRYGDETPTFLSLLNLWRWRQKHV